MARMTLKSSTIFISLGGETKVYRSVDEVPPAARNKLRESTNGLNAATILIADRKGREEIVKAIQGMPSGIRGRMASSFQANQEKREARLRLDWRTWMEILLPGIVGLLIWLAFTYK